MKLTLAIILALVWHTAAQELPGNAPFIVPAQVKSNSCFVCTNCAYCFHAPKTNLLVSWTYGTNLVNGFNWCQTGTNGGGVHTLRFLTNWLQVWASSTINGKWRLYLLTTNNPVVLPCIGNGFYGFQLAWQ